MTGFTAINAPSSSTGPLNTAVPSVPKRLRSTSSPYTSSGSKTVASDYLGRGNPDGADSELKEGSGALHGLGPRKTRGTGRKRSNTTASQRNAKRQKTNDVSSGMRITKPAVKAKHKSTANSTRSTPVNEAESSNANSASSRPYFAAPEDQPQTVSVVAPSTSMESLHSSPQPTSINAVRSSGHGATVYRGAESRAEGPDSRLASQHVSLQWVKRSTEGSDTRVLWSQNANISPTGTSCYGSAAKEVDEGARESESPVDRNKTQPQSTTRTGKAAVNAKSTATSKTLSEDFIGDDDEEDLLQALDQAVSTKARSHTSYKRKTSNEVQQSRASKAGSLRRVSAGKGKGSMRRATPILGPEEELMQLCDEDGAEFIELTDNVEEKTAQRSPTPSLRNNKLNFREVDPHEDYGGASLSDTDMQLLAQMKSSQSTEQSVILRKPFPTAILDRSPIFGATNTTMLRTCFRLGEALNVGSSAVRTNTNVIFELYARVSSSHREGRKQHFVFRDLYHDHPPHLEGTFELWQQSPLWDLDGRAFLTAKNGQDGIMCRLIGRMKKELEPGGFGRIKYRLEILSIWEADWEDVDYVAGIYARD